MPRTNHLGKHILFLDGHESHITLHLIDYASETNVILCCLPQHTTHKLQPLNLSLYKPLKNQFSSITDFIILVSVTGNMKVIINKTNFPVIFREAFEKTMCPTMIISGYREAGIYPFNPDIVRAAKKEQSILLIDMVFTLTLTSNILNFSENSGYEPCNYGYKER